MIRGHIVWRVFCREVLDTFRDLGMLMIVFLLPLAIIPSSAIFGLEVASRKSQALSAPGELPKLHWPGKLNVTILGPGAAALEEKVQKVEGFAVLPPPNPDWQNPEFPKFGRDTKSPDATSFHEEARRRIAARELDAILLTGTEPAGETLTNTWLVLFSDMTIPRSQKAGGVLAKHLAHWKKELRTQRLETLGQTEASLDPFRFFTREATSREQQMVWTIAPAIPALLYILLGLGCLYPAAYGIPGEKDRGTLATLLSAPISPLELLLGKWLNIVLLGCSSALITFLSAVASLLVLGRAASTMGSLFEGTAGAAALWPVVGLLLLALIILGMVLSAIMLLLCLFPRGLADTNYLATPLVFFLVLPAIPAMFSSVKLTLATSLIPAANISLLIRDLLQQSPIAAGPVFLCFLSNALFTAAVLGFAARIFESEHIRFGEVPAWKSLFARPAFTSPNVIMSLAAFLLLMVGGFYLSVGLKDRPLPLIIIAIQAWIVLLPLALVWYFRVPWRETLSWQSPRPHAWPGSILLGLTAWVLTIPLVKIIAPPAEWMAAFAQPFLDLLAQPGGLALALALFAVLPAICEEIAFRGLIQAGLLRRFSPGVAITLGSLAFALVHFSLYRFAPTLVLGLLLGWVAWRTRSLFPGMLIHALNNGLMMATLPLSEQKIAPFALPILTLAAAGCAGGFFWLHRATRPAPSAFPADNT